jgi:acyl-CoA synthetase (AMP-forming)/AMP-acid ligase II
MNASTITEVLADRAVTNAEDTAFVFLNDRGEETRRITYLELFTRACGAAERLARYEEQARIVIVLPTSVEFPVTMLGCLLAGKIAVPLAVPNNHRSGDMLAMLDDCQPSCLVTTNAMVSGLKGRLNGTQWQSLEILTAQEFPADHQFRPKPISEQSIALLQYTSGSTSMPKGVIVRHRNMMANHTMLKDAFGLDRKDTVVGWTPLHHDQGLIGNLLHPLFTGSRCVLMPPIAFLRSPLLWLRVISRYHAHTSGGPNFAYNLCVDRFDANECVSIDLSSWEIAFNGAEPVSATTIRRFGETFEPYGFNRDAMFPCYGMAEATLFVSGGPRGKGAAFLKPDEIHAANGARELVSSGTVHPAMSILISPLDNHEPANGPLEPVEQEIGEICIAGPNVTSGYWKRDSDDLMFDAASGVRYLRTGDLGFVGAEGLYVTGRKKELIVIRGRNVYPYDIERTITGSDAIFQPGGCAVFSVAKEEMGEEVVAVQEILRTARHTFVCDELAGVVRRNVIRDHDIRLKRLYFVVPGFIPRTTSGKIRRVALANSLRCQTIGQSGIVATC